MNATLTNSTELAFWQYSVPPIFVIFIHVVNFFLSVPLNIYIIILLFSSRAVRDASDVFSWNQAISDILFVLLGPFHSLCSVNLKLCFFKAVGFFFGMSLSSRSLFQCCVCLERYLAVVHPVIFLRYKPLRYRVACSVTAWICSLAVAAVCTWTFPYMPYQGFSVIYLFILTVNFFCCVSILKKLRLPGVRDIENDVSEMNAAKKKAFQIVSFNLLASLIQNMPLFVAFGIQSSLTEYEFNLIATISFAINIVTEFWQPVHVLYRAGKLPLIQST